MPSFRRRASVIDDDSASASPKDPDRAVDAAQARALADEAEAEAAEAEALAAAARARARAARLRRQAEEAEASPVEEKVVSPAAVATSAADTEITASGGADVESEAIEADAEPSAIDTVASADEPEQIDVIDDDDASADEKAARKRLHLRVPLPTWKAVALALAVLCTCALLAASGFMIWHHQKADRQAQLNAEYSAAARQSVVTLMSLDFNKAKEGVQRIIDNSTGTFKADFQAQADNFAKVAQDSKVITEVTVNSTAVNSMTDNTANVLVSATSRITNTAGAKKDPRAWRLSVDLQREGDQVKLAKVEFVP